LDENYSLCWSFDYKLFDSITTNRLFAVSVGAWVMLEESRNASLMYHHHSLDEILKIQNLAHKLADSVEGPADFYKVTEISEISVKFEQIPNPLLSQINLS
jgi:hypothetical protein